VTAANSVELTQLRATIAECRPEPGKLSPTGTFLPTKETKAVAVDPADPTKTIRVGPISQPNMSSRSSTSSTPTRIPLPGSRLTCQAFPRRSLSTNFASCQDRSPFSNDYAASMTRGVEP